MFPTSHAAYAGLGSVQSAEHKNDAAIVSYQHAHAINRTLALIYANQDRNLERALELAEADFEIRKHVYTYHALSWVLYKNRRYEQARKCSEEALKLGTPMARGRPGPLCRPCAARARIDSGW